MVRARPRSCVGGCFCGARQRGPAPARRAGDLLRINFNISFPHLACQYASVDLSDVLGMVRPPQRRERSVAPAAERASLLRARRAARCGTT